jgi:GGDEF domain-containing protein
MADKIIATISQPIHALGVVVRVGASIGINICDSHDISLKDVSAAADRALYQAKAAGGRRFIFSARLSEPG